MAFPPSPHGFMFQQHLEDTHDHHLPPPNFLNSLSSCPPQLFHGGGGGGGGGFMMKRSFSFSGADKSSAHHDEVDDELSDDGSQMLGEKKKRLNLEQVKALEKSFELGNKLEPERKLQLAKALGLQPRQIAIWFQNRRARWKTKQLERDYGVLKKQYEALKADNDALHSHNDKLNAELMALKNKDSSPESNIKKETHEGSWSNGSNNSYDINLETSRTPVITSPDSSQLNLFPSSTNMTQLLQSSARPNLHNHHQQQHQMVHEDQTFCNIFNAGMDDQQGFWPWPDQQQNFH